MTGAVDALDFSNSKYIWKSAPTGPNGAQRTGNATFRRDWTPPVGKVPVSADILINADDVYTLFVNGGKVGSGNVISAAQRYCVRLVDSCNTFAIEAQNVPDNTPAGVLTTIQVKYTDGFTDTIVSDTQWHATGNAPAGFEQVAFDDSTWPAAFDQGPYPTKPGYSITLPPAPASPNSGAGPSLPSANWIWTKEVSSGSQTAPNGGRAFRKRVNLPNGDLVNSAVITLAADNQYTLYVNGLAVGSGTDYRFAQRFVVNFPPTSTVVIAIFAANTGGPAGLIAAVELVNCDCSDNVYLVTDGGWKYSNSVPNGFPSLGFDDSAWDLVNVEGKYGAAPWGQTTIPTNNSPQSAPLPGAPPAAPASVVA
ncbi:hypothetical protein BDZ94DRAFT_1262236 [Collybia nuda]|uniref:Lectin n=1 Tax=Collybia nuda TaxID=64659 RepID=A0A9P6CDP7_9AGAR|nr:hypothetical protein BDZ94DRAFT_1262236 [Collybia nuda]